MKSASNVKGIMFALFVAISLVTDRPVIGQQLREAAPTNELINDIAVTHPASAYIEPSTLLVVEVDWQKIDVDALFKLVTQLTGDRPGEAPLAKQLFEKMREGKAGKVYFLAGFQTPVDGMPLVIIPTPEPATLLASVESVLGKRPPSVEVAINELGLVFGTSDQLKRVGSMNPVWRDELLMPLKDAKRLDHTAVLALPGSTRELLGRIWPGAHPDDIPIDVSPSDLVQGVDRIILTIRTPPDPLVRLIVDTSSSEAADLFTKQFAALKRTFGDALANVTIRRDAQRVTLEADDDVLQHGQSIAADARARAREERLVTTLKQLGIAFYNYSDQEKHLPPRCFVDPDGKPLHSWMIAILPYFDQLALYRSIRLDLAWNASENSRLENTVPSGIGDQSLPVAHTSIRAPVFPGSLWHGDGPPKTFKDITDNRSGTILLVDAPPDASIHWADPSPWIISETNPMKDLFGDRDAARVLLADGSVLLLKRSETDNDKLKAMLTIAGGD